MSVSTEQAPATESLTATGTPAAEHWLLCAVLVGVGMFLSIFNSLGLNVVFAAIQKEFLALTQDMQWVATGYLLTMGIAIPLSVWLADRLGLRRLYMLMLGMFAATSLLCAFADSLQTLVLLRVLQAIPGALVPVTAITLLVRLTPVARMRTAMCLYVGGAVAGMGFGPLLSASLTDSLSWRWVFAVEVPISLVALVIAAAVLPTLAGRPDRHFDVPGFVTIALGLCAIMLAISQGQLWGWTSYKVLLLLAVGTNALALFVGIELWVEQPLLNVRVFALRSYVIALVMVELVFTGMTLSLSDLSAFLLKIQGLTSTNTGLDTVPAGLTFMVMSLCAVLFGHRLGARWPVIIGMATMACGMLMLSRVTVDIPRSQMIVSACVVLAGAGLCLVPVMGSIVTSLPPDQVGDGTVLRVVVQRILAPLGLTAFTAFATVQQAGLFSNQTGLIQSGNGGATPEVTQLREHGPQALSALAQRLQLMAQAHALSEVLLVVGSALAVAAATVLVSGWGRAPRLEAGN
ncbi:MFS transporter [Pseudonocardia spinosispora]|uniref:MFS transporter n=1 Tax=Pseudonocardia spinosispora TaxID=103441 RepID=UPI00041F8DB1|nr:MFS transporter [Pseudonocardia spinosispora]